MAIVGVTILAMLEGIARVLLDGVARFIDCFESVSEVFMDRRCRGLSRWLSFSQVSRNLLIAF